MTRFYYNKNYIDNYKKFKKGIRKEKTFKNNFDIESNSKFSDSISNKIKIHSIKNESSEIDSENNFSNENLQINNESQDNQENLQNKNSESSLSDDSQYNSQYLEYFNYLRTIAGKINLGFISVKGRVRSYFAIEPEKKSIKEILNLISKLIGNGQIKCIPLSSDKSIIVPEFYKMSIMKYTTDHSYLSYFLINKENDEEQLKQLYTSDPSINGYFKKFNFSPSFIKQSKQN